MSRKTIEREARQRFIINAARRLFAEKGIENTSMEDIAAAVEYTRRTLYAYFKSRDDICMQVFIEELTGRWRLQREAMFEVRTGLEKIMKWGESFYRYAKTNPHAMKLQFYWDYRGIDRDRLDQKVFQAFEKINDELAEGLREIFRLGIEDGSLRNDLKTDLCISQYLYSLRSILNRAVSPGYSFAVFDPDEYVKHFLELFARGIRNTEKKKR
ncbi:MAG: TetR/AcrR family transcriptional regulator [Candidatus Zixiibacteriota bacterium]